MGIYDCGITDPEQLNLYHETIKRIMYRGTGWTIRYISERNDVYDTHGKYLCC